MIKNSSTVQRKNIRTLQYLPLRKYSQIFKSHSGNCTSSLNLIFFSPETLQKHVEKSHGYLIWDTLMLSLKTIYKDLTHMQLWSGGCRKVVGLACWGGAENPFRKRTRSFRAQQPSPPPLATSTNRYIYIEQLFLVTFFLYK